jgi:hypothetical protein
VLYHSLGSSFREASFTELKHVQHLSALQYCKKMTVAQPQELSTRTGQWKVSRTFNRFNNVSEAFCLQDIDDDPHLPNQEERHVRGQGPNLSQK